MDNPTALWSAILACTYGELIEIGSQLRASRDSNWDEDLANAETWARLLHAAAETATEETE